MKILEINRKKLDAHIKRLCRKNLMLDGVKCCASCPFEGVIVE